VNGLKVEFTSFLCNGENILQKVLAPESAVLVSLAQNLEVTRERKVRRLASIPVWQRKFLLSECKTISESSHYHEELLPSP